MRLLGRQIKQSSSIAAFKNNIRELTGEKVYSAGHSLLVVNLSFLFPFYFASLYLWV